MSDFMLTPEAPLDAPTGPLRLVQAGLADTAEMPKTHRARPDPPPCYAPCAACGTPVLTGITGAGVRLAVDPGIATYVVDWDHQAPAPRLVASRGYPVHCCPPTRLEGARLVR